ncbi:MAG: hypothetical protein C4532_17860 [Candidatus Abyssobacteria bacterium SURF_17]|jgi:ribosomal protein S18 acetylase RimI-like enzyme|uniref:GNAT family N-acetyltransferase n=1 Tax=Candidatus Abyssobacteria bacterium SURF_17 TaxID=2093361 RepID=A0A419EQE4_9BACT|nr:MAG: hypothetical protein C4532_17860 [Candidatus Abyssubacteria bacterium SURF_17]
MSKKPLIWRGASRTLRLLGIRFYDSFYLEKNLGTNIEPVAPSIELDISPATKGDINEIIRTREQAVLNRFQIAEAFEGVCYCAKQGKQITGNIWVTRKAIILDDFHVADLPPDGAYLFGAYVFSCYRGKKVYQSLRDHAYSTVRDAGCAFAASLVGRNSIPAVVARNRSGLLFQDARLLKLPGSRVITLGKPFVIGASVSGGSPA